ncbi:hypothetical protein D9601_02360 [Sphingomonas sp. MA1305]|uniref:hypothetical protein n=1 Tax=Sphingomonas sp. MA1305 TaxID=2479204 RepID=UPI0018DFEA0B|nr:hypothetical protein [Sphingomonas sp. MA1305]MBI0474208.1 hypothetical protein [Sphingomonas sp. MA1305]
MSWLEANWGTVAGWVAAAIGPFTVYLTMRRKTDVDESAMILGKWKELVEAHEKAIAAVREEFASYRVTAIAEIADLRTRLSKAEMRITELEVENAGLKRSIAQNSQSTAHMLGSPGRRNSLPGDEL